MKAKKKNKWYNNFLFEVNHLELPGRTKMDCVFKRFTKREKKKKKKGETKKNFSLRNFS